MTPKSVLVLSLFSSVGSVSRPDPSSGRLKKQKVNSVSLFTPYRPRNYKFFEPERFTTAEANLRRTQAMLLEHERAWKRFEQGLSPATLKKANNALAKAIVNEPKSRVQKAASIAAALKGFTERDFADPQKRAAYRELRSKQGGQQKVTPSGADKRQFNPTGKDFASTIYGTTARLTGWTNVAAGARSAWSPMFVTPGQVVPCVQRSVRRQVMFAKRFAGVGYHSKKRRTWASEVPC